MANSGSITTKLSRCPAACRRRLGQFGFRGTHAIQELGARDERNAQACGRQQDASISGIVLHVMNAALYGSDSDGISNEIGLKAGLDDKQSADLIESHHS